MKLMFMCVLFMGVCTGCVTIRSAKHSIVPALPFFPHSIPIWEQWGGDISDEKLKGTEEDESASV